jgi:hypothetical protein
VPRRGAVSIRTAPPASRRTSTSPLPLDNRFAPPNFNISPRRSFEPPPGSKARSIEVGSTESLADRPDRSQCAIASKRRLSHVRWPRSRRLGVLLDLPCRHPYRLLRPRSLEPYPIKDCRRGSVGAFVRPKNYTLVVTRLTGYHRVKARLLPRVSAYFCDTSRQAVPCRPHFDPRGSTRSRPNPGQRFRQPLPHLDLRRISRWRGRSGARGLPTTTTDRCR